MASDYHGRCKALSNLNANVKPFKNCGGVEFVLIDGRTLAQGGKGGGGQTHSGTNGTKRRGCEAHHGGAPNPAQASRRSGETPGASRSRYRSHAQARNGIGHPLGQDGRRILANRSCDFSRRLWGCGDVRERPCAAPGAWGCCPSHRATRFGSAAKNPRHRRAKSPSAAKPMRPARSGDSPHK